ncbi:MAG: helix-turn-helix domain-containing protein [Dactylosporangium sp.]|nr:helix-turn-helix domain-containing protein [Dactylosporangium sp.]NNJ61596.1 helix-turn-helix domain-containing protein [Dactylosporangium sp.]
MGVTIDQVAAHLECSASKISRIETGHTSVTPRDVYVILTMYGISTAEIDELVGIAREAREKGWWHRFGDVLTSTYVGLEAGADQICSYEAQVIPGLLQTSDYARAMLMAVRSDLSEGEVHRRVHVRSWRQSLLTQDEPIDFRVVLDEAALRRPVGGAAVMHQQLRYLILMARRPNVVLQVLPFACGAHPGMDGTFTILRYEESTGQSVVFTDNAVGGTLLEKDEELQRYAFVFGLIQACSLTPDESIAMIASLLERGSQDEWRREPAS